MAKQPAVVCEDDHCDQPVRMAVQTSRTKSNGLRSTVYYDADDAPVRASRYCKRHGGSLAADLVRHFTAPDDYQEAPCPSS